MNNLTRRELLSLGVVGLTGCMETSSASTPETIEVEIHQSEEVQTMAGREDRPETHALDVTSEAVRVCLSDLTERVPLIEDFDVTTVEEPVDLGYAGGLRQSWREWDQQTNWMGGNPDSRILLADGAGIDVIGRARGDIAINVTAGDLLTFDSGGVEAEKVVQPGSDLFSVYQSLMVTVHEVGHNLDLDHKHGFISDEEPPRVTPMVLNYFEKFNGTETACGGQRGTVEMGTENDTAEFMNETVEFKQYGGPSIQEPIRCDLRFSECAASALDRKI